MKIGILETGPVVSHLKPEHGSYPDMFAKMLSSVDPSFQFSSWTVFENQMPKDPAQMDGWIITGSKFGAYEDHKWIPPLEAFLRDCLSRKIPIAGICFGHQILAQAMGGRVEKSTKGWGLGVHDYAITNNAALKVLDAPENTTVLATSEFCPIAALAYGEPEAPIAITVQPHPEFDADFVEDLIAARRGTAFPETIADDALSTLRKPIHKAEWAQWFVNFFKGAVSNTR